MGLNMSMPKDIISRALSEGRNFLLEPEAKLLCAYYGIPVTKFKIARNLDEAKRFASEIGYPVVLKIVSPDVLHKTDVGAVIVNIKNEEELVRAYNTIMENVKKHKPNARIIGMIVQEFVPQSLEVIVGVSKDPQFGHAIMFGLGGIFVEVLKDVTFRILPITDKEAREMLREVKGYPLLKGYRGREPLDEDAIVDIMIKVSKMIEENPMISQLDLNPIIVYTKGAKVVDARIILET